MKEQKEVSLNDLYLDPGNFRIIDKVNELNINTEEEGLKEVKQNQLLNILIGGNKAENIQDLIKSFQTNGIIEVNQIYVKKNPESKYIVMEGNRRVATLKYIYKKYMNKEIELGKLDEEIFKKIPVVIYSESDERKHLFITGLDHITGKVKWSSKNQAEYIYNLINKQKYSQNETTEHLPGLSKYEIRRSLKTYAFMKEYQRSDMGGDIDQINYTVFRTIISKSKIKQWLNLSFDNENDCRIIEINMETTERLFGWISPQESKEKGYSQTPIKNESDVNLLDKIINDETALQILEENGDIYQAVSSLSIHTKENIQKNLKSAKNLFKSVSEFSSFLESDDIIVVNEIKEISKNILYSTRKSIGLNDKSRQIINIIPNEHFSSIAFKDFKILNEVELNQPGKINIIAGKNNAGKTTVLEGIYLLTNINDPSKYLNILKKRGRMVDPVKSKWYQENSASLCIEGVFNLQKVDLSVKQVTDDSDEMDKTNYLTSILLESNISGRKFSSKIQLFDISEVRMQYSKVYSLCNFTYINPFSFSLKEESYKHLSESMEFKSDIIAFIQEEIDNEIKDIEFDPVKERFIVILSKGTRDLAMYGSGLQYLFLTSILFGYARDGVVLIDEIENGIHYSLMLKYTLFLQKLSERFNTQVFITSHSDDCINAFVQNNYRNTDVVGYHIFEDKEKKNKLSVERVPGIDLKKYLTNFGYDLRGEA